MGKLSITKLGMAVSLFMLAKDSFCIGYIDTIDRDIATEVH